MKPGYFVALVMLLIIVGEYFFKSKEISFREVLIFLIAALAASVFAGLIAEGGLELFRIFMLGSTVDPEWEKGATLLAAEKKEGFIYFHLDF